MDEMLKKVLEAVGKTPEEFEKEVQALQEANAAHDPLADIRQQQADTSALVMELIEVMLGGQ